MHGQGEPCKQGETFVYEHCRAARSSGKKKKTQQMEDVKKAFDAIVLPPKQQRDANMPAQRAVLSTMLDVVNAMPGITAECVAEMLRIGESVPDVNERFRVAMKNIGGPGENMYVKKAVLSIILSLRTDAAR